MNFVVNWTDTRVAAKNKRWKEVDYYTGIWYPKFQFQSKFDLHLKRMVGQAGESFDPYFWLHSDVNSDNSLEYMEEIQITIGCTFDFSMYPFDVNTCRLIFSELGYPNIKNVLEPTILLYYDKMSQSEYLLDTSKSVV